MPTSHDVNSILRRALEIESPAGRTAYLDEACGPDAALRLEVERLLAAERAVVDEQMTQELGRRLGRPYSCAQPDQIDDYRILREIGRGGMGIVYEAEQVSLGRRVALKILPREMLANPRMRQRFEREAKSAARLHHSNIVPVFSVGVEDTPYYAMQFIDGLPLDRVLKEMCRLRKSGGQGGKSEAADLSCAAAMDALQTGEFPSAPDVTTDRPAEVSSGSQPPVSSRPAAPAPGAVLPGLSGSQSGAKKQTYWQSIARLGAQAADALAYAHNQGVRHRDIKPSNLLLDTAGTIWVTDFGLAKADDQEDLTQTGDVLGTLRYMPPEAFEGQFDARGDVYALGLTLYEMLAFEPAFNEKDRPQLIRQVTIGAPPRLRLRNPEVPRDLETIVHKAIEREPANRYQSAGGLAADLERFLRDEPIRARRTSLAEYLVRWARRHKELAGALAALLVVLVTVSIGSSVAAVRFRTIAEAAEQAARAERLQSDRANAAVRAERWERYRSNMAAAASAFQLHNVGTARGALEAAPEEHRNWEWRHFYHQLDGAREVWRGQEGTVLSLTLSRDGKWLAYLTVNQSHAVYVRDLTSEKKEPVLIGRANGPVLDLSERAAAFSLADNTIRLWDLHAGKTRFVLRGHEGPLSWVRFSPDGKRLASGSADETVRLWDTATGKQLLVLRGHKDRIGSVEFSPDGQRLLSSGRNDHTARVWDATTGRQLAVLRGHEGVVSNAAFSPDGGRIVTVGYYPENNLRLWDATTLQLIAVLRGHSNQITDLVFSKDGRRIASGSFDQTVRLWDGFTGQALATLSGHTGWVKAAMFSPDGKRLISASQDQTLRLWAADTGALLAVLHGHTSDVLTVVYSPDGDYLVSGSSDGTLRLWDARLVERSGVLRRHGNFVYGVAFHPDGARVASAAWDGTVRLWDATAGVQTALLSYQKDTIVTSVSFHPAGGHLATLGRDESVRLWDVTSRELHRWRISTKGWQDGRLTFNRQGNLLAAGSMAGSVHLWDVASRAEVAVLRGHTAAVRDVAFSPDGKWLASCSEDLSVRIWDVARKEQVQILQGHTSGVYCLAFHGNGQLLASGSLDGTVRLYDVERWQEVAVLKLGSNVYSLAFSPDGTRLACACADNTIRLWDVASRQEVVELRGHGAYVHQVAWSADGTRLASGSGDFSVRIWDSLPGHERARRARAAEGK